MDTKGEEKKEQLLTESESRLIIRYIELRKTLGHMEAILKIAQEERKRLGDTESAIAKIAEKIFAAYLQKTMEESTF